MIAQVYSFVKDDIVTAKKDLTYVQQYLHASLNEPHDIIDQDFKKLFLKECDTHGVTGISLEQHFKSKGGKEDFEVAQALYKELIYVTEVEG